MSAANVTVESQQPSASEQNNDAASSSYANVVLNLKSPHEDKNDNNKENIGKDVNQTKPTVDSYANNNNVQPAAAAANAIVVVAPKISSANDEQQPQHQQLPSSDHENEDDLTFIPVVSHSRKEKKIARKERTYKDKAGPSASNASKLRNRPDRSENNNSDKKEHRRSKDRKGDANNKDAAAAAAVSVEQQTSNGEAGQKSGIDEENESNPVKFVEAPIPKVNAWKVLFSLHFFSSLNMIWHIFSK